MYRDDWDFDHHPACRCGCGQLADECSDRRPAPLGSMTVTSTDFDYDYRPTCKWRNCTLEVDRHGLCDVHLGTL